MNTSASVQAVDGDYYARHMFQKWGSRRETGLMATVKQGEKWGSCFSFMKGMRKTFGPSVSYLWRKLKEDGCPFETRHPDQADSTAQLQGNKWEAKPHTTGTCHKVAPEAGHINTTCYQCLKTVLGLGKWLSWFLAPLLKSWAWEHTPKILVLGR